MHAPREIDSLLGSLACPVLGSVAAVFADCECHGSVNPHYGMGVTLLCNGSGGERSTFEIGSRRLTTKRCHSSTAGMDVDMHLPVESEVCIEVEYHRQFLQILSWTAGDCIYTVNGKDCNSCSITNGGFPRPEYSLDCSNLEEEYSSLE